MKRLVVLAAVLKVCSACFSSVPTVPQAPLFECPAPNGQGLQAAFDEFGKYGVEDLPFLVDSYAVTKIVNITYKPMLDAIFLLDPSFIRLHSYLCERVFVDSSLYYMIFLNFAWNIGLLAQDHPIPPIEESQYREDFLKFASKIYNSEKYKRSREILDYHIAHDGYAQLGMEEVYSSEMKTIVQDFMKNSIPKVLDAVESYGINPDDVADLFVYFTLSSWEN